MKNRLSIILLALFALGAVSCVQEILPEPDKQKEKAELEEGLVTRSYEISFAEETKATLSSDIPVWEVNETVAVWDPIKSKVRSFTVTEADATRAKITGEISEGTFAFSAVYPESCAGTWTSIDNFTWKLPETQVLAAGRVIGKDALVSTAYTTTPEQGIIFKNQVSLLQFSIERENIESVSIELNDGTAAKTFTAKVSSGSFSQNTTYYLAVAPGEYSSGIKVSCTNNFDVSYNKTSKKKLSAVRNGQVKLGVVSDGVKHVNYTIAESETRHYSNLDSFLEATGITQDETYQYYMGKSFIKSIVNSIISNYFPVSDKPVTILNYTYKSVDPKGNPCLQSASLTYTDQSVGTTDKNKKMNGTILVSHTSSLVNWNCPTKTMSYETAGVWANWAIVMPDYYGFGASSSNPQAYLSPELAARGSIDAYEAALQIMADMGIAHDAKLDNLGYSQGGFNALANVKYVSEHPELGITFNKTFAGGGPHDVEYTQSEYLANNYPNANIYLLASMVAYKETESLSAQYSDMFLNSNLADWIRSKNYSENSIWNKLGTKDMTQILAPGILNKSGDAYNQLMNVSKKYNLASGSWKPASGSKIYLYHSPADEIVPYGNLAKIKTYLDAHKPSSGEIKYLDLGTGLITKTLHKTIISNTNLNDVTVTHEAGAGFFMYDIVVNKGL